ncbi:DNA/RNA helicase domain-containing protein [Gaopeijia maritima]|uniref:DNA/RNA helicase domain-containing protein n=1 Tax=Gaopeijia maritima TaxID=3119007 RepID=UPI0032965B24
MIVYHATKKGFTDDVETGAIDDVVLAAYQKALGSRVGEAERRAWQNSLNSMYIVVRDDEIPADAGVSIELQIPQTSKRVDFIISGQDTERRDRAVVVELKQWESAEVTGMDGVVRTWVGHAHREVSHPSYQAWSYTQLLRDFNEEVQQGDIGLHACAYLHNFTGTELDDPCYASWVEAAPLFRKGEAAKLRDFIKRYVKYGDSTQIAYRIDRGRIRPSKSLADAVAGLMKGNAEFTMIDEQKVVYERALQMVRDTPVGEKRVLIVEGGPGTGKSVVAVNLVARLTQDQELSAYITKNAAPRAVFESRLTGSMTKSRYSNLFRGSGGFITAERGTFRTLVVDEAHRLNEKSGLYQNLGDNQIKELIHAADVTVFFLDEDQRVAFQDIGSKDEILFWATELGAEVEEMELESQFRCNGSDGYIAWLDHVLQIRETANTRLDELGYDFDFRVFDDPSSLRAAIEAKNEERNRARMVAGYCWRWMSKKDRAAWDIVFEEHDFRMRWNLADDGGLWVVKPESVSEIGCIHTCQGLEVDTIGVIIGPDLIVRDGRVITRAEERDRFDNTIRGYKSRHKTDPEGARADARRVILNTYRTLMSRGMKGCWVWSVDEETNAWLKEMARGSTAVGPT